MSRFQPQNPAVFPLSRSSAHSTRTKNGISASPCPGRGPLQTFPPPSPCFQLRHLLGWAYQVGRVIVPDGIPGGGQRIVVEGRKVLLIEGYEELRRGAGGWR
ncbi:hypothetical protein, partial [Clostridium sp. D5]|uniref:hypothetical protein n=1 Tax=Clostridium sp. D5 TaxID=556261 RepID=UPI001A99DC46